MSITVDRDPTRAREQAVDVAQRALRAGADLVVLPELVVPGYTTDLPALLGLAEPVPGPTSDALVEVARAENGVVVFGLAEAAHGAIFNTAVAVSGDGVIGHYRKLHLFGPEKQAFSPGDLGLPVFESAIGHLGLCICYDLRFPEVVRILALRGADLVCAPAAWVAGFDTVPSGMPGQVQAAVVHANLNQVYVACASQVGQPGEHRFLGCSVVVGPFGELTVGPLSSECPEVATAQIDAGRCRSARHRSDLITPRADRRTDVYGIVYEGEKL
jgi:predicted amidohydrolase